MASPGIDELLDDWIGAIADNESETGIMLLNHIQLMRFHHKPHEKEDDKEFKAPPVAIPEKKDTTDSLKPRIHRLGDRPNMNQPTIKR